MRSLGSVYLTRKGKRIQDVLEARRWNLECVGWPEKNNRGVERKFKFMFCGGLDGLSHVGGQSVSGV